jgi:T5orf172 domain.
LKPATDKERKSQGHAYIYADPTNKEGYFKIGRSGAPLTRERVYRAKYKHPTFVFVNIVPRQPIREVCRLESLAQAELSNLKYSFDCRCFTAHKEFFMEQWMRA